MRDPAPLQEADCLVVESTYGDRLHGDVDIQERIGEIINKTTAKGGSIIIPAFAVGRAQSILYHLHQLKTKKIIADIPVYLDSPMSIRATEVLCKHHKLHKLSADDCKDITDSAKYVQSVEESKAIDHEPYPSVIVSASGMASGGRVLHHMKAFLRDHKNTVLFAGYQAAGTRGRKLVEGAKTVRIHGEDYDVKARIANLDTASAHADYSEILQWLATMRNKPNKVFITHGEDEARTALGNKIRERFSWDVCIPDYLDSYSI